MPDGGAEELVLGGVGVDGLIGKQGAHDVVALLEDVGDVEDGPVGFFADREAGAEAEAPVFIGRSNGGALLPEQPAAQRNFRP